MKNIVELIMDLMDKYEWMPASIARFGLEHNIDIDTIMKENAL